jgi:hypothetical protein
MAIIKTKFGTTRPILWDGEEVAQVRGLTPNDLSSILSQEGNGLQAMLACLDDIDFTKANEQDITAGLMKAGPSIVVKLSREFPAFIATVIAVAGDGEDDAVEWITQYWPLGLQLEAMIQICSLTFSGPEGFRAFVGNVFALVKLTDTLTGAGQAPSPAASPGLGNGASMSLS